VVLLFRGTSAILARLPLSITEPVARWLFMVGYMLWPAKRRIVEVNCGHVLGLPPDDPAARRLAAASRGSSWFALELMRCRPCRSMSRCACCAVGEDHGASWRSGRNASVTPCAHRCERSSADRGFASAYAARHPTWPGDDRLPELSSCCAVARAGRPSSVAPASEVFGCAQAGGPGHGRRLGYRPTTPTTARDWTTLPATCDAGGAHRCGHLPVGDAGGRRLSASAAAIRVCRPVTRRAAACHAGHRRCPGRHGRGSPTSGTRSSRCSLRAWKSGRLRPERSHGEARGRDRGGW
jgi:hypothetical protein